MRPRNIPVHLFRSAAPLPRGLMSRVGSRELLGGFHSVESGPREGTFIHDHLHFVPSEWCAAGLTGGREGKGEREGREREGG